MVVWFDIVWLLFEESKTIFRWKGHLFPKYRLKFYILSCGKSQQMSCLLHSPTCESLIDKLYRCVTVDNGPTILSWERRSMETNVQSAHLFSQGTNTLAFIYLNLNKYIIKSGSAILRKEGEKGRGVDGRANRPYISLGSYLNWRMQRRQLRWRPFMTSPS